MFEYSTTPSASALDESTSECTGTIPAPRRLLVNGALDDSATINVGFIARDKREYSRRPADCDKSRDPRPSPRHRGCTSAGVFPSIPAGLALHSQASTCCACAILGKTPTPHLL